MVKTDMAAWLHPDVLEVAAKALEATAAEIGQVEVLKKGMTNRSFCFSCHGQRYVMRIPGEGTDKLIDRAQEADAYRAIRGRGLCDDPVYLDPHTGVKIARYLEDARPCDPLDPADVDACMEKLRSFHAMHLKVGHTFDLFDKIDFYEGLWGGAPSQYADYAETKAQVSALRPFLEAYRLPYSLTHIDAVPDNFLFTRTGGAPDWQLTDWEYAGMQDPHVDLAMFCIYAMYDRVHIDALIDAYFLGPCPEVTRTKIYAYIAVCGLLWSNWCEYKRQLGVEFGEYAQRQYRFAQEYSSLARERLQAQPLSLPHAAADNAIIMAAGTSSRFAPLSYEMPKALLEVRGEILIERQIRQLQAAGIPRIFVVVGYKKAQFAYLTDRFGVTLIENPDYAVRNNNGSIWAARGVLGNSYICSADNYFTCNPFEYAPDGSYYAALYADGPTAEWCMREDANGLICDVQIGGRDAWYMLGHAFWERTFSQTFLKILAAVYDRPDVTAMLWEDIYRRHLPQLPMRIRRYPDGAIFEFDTLDELRCFDAGYRANTRSAILRELSRRLGGGEEELTGATALYGSDNTAVGFRFDFRGVSYRYTYEEGRLELWKE